MLISIKRDTSFWMHELYFGSSFWCVGVDKASPDEKLLLPSPVMCTGMF